MLDECVLLWIHLGQWFLSVLLQEGETIRINVKTKGPGSGTGMLSGATGPSNVISSTGRMKAPLAPPPGGGRIRSPLPPPPNDNKSIRTSPVSSTLKSAHGADKSGRASADPFSDLSQLEVLLFAHWNQHIFLYNLVDCDFSELLQFTRLFLPK